MSSHSVVLIGSHGFGARGSRINEESFLIVENDPETAQRCTVHIEAYYRHYAFKSATSETAALKLQSNDTWQDRFTEPAELAQLAFWMGDDARTFAAPQPADASALAAAQERSEKTRRQVKSSQTQSRSAQKKAAPLKKPKASPQKQLANAQRNGSCVSRPKRKNSAASSPLDPISPQLFNPVHTGLQPAVN